MVILAQPLVNLTEFFTGHIENTEYKCPKLIHLSDKKDSTVQQQENNISYKK